LRGAGSPPEAPLPAPYESPWLALSRSLQAVVADLWLRLRRLWRLRRWLLIGLGLALVLVLLLAGFGLRQLLPQATPDPEPIAASESIAAPPPSPAPAEVPAAELPRQGDPDPIAEPAVPQTAVPQPAVPELAVPEPDPLLDAFASAEPGWIAAASPSPERDLLTLTLVAAPPRSSDPSLLRRLERWQALAKELGYGNLEVCTAERLLLARSALVGSGMILLDSSFPS
jgi:hypothetical protein